MRLVALLHNESTNKPFRVANWIKGLLILIEGDSTNRPSIFRLVIKPPWKKNDLTILQPAGNSLS